MTNEMQLAHAAGLPGTAGELGLPPGGNQKQKPIGLKKIHRLLRGRYPLVITLGLIFGVAGALTGYLAEQPMFKSSFQVEINSTIHSATSDVGQEMSGYERFLHSQIATIRSSEEIQRAMDEDEWKSAAGAPQSEAGMVKFASELEAENFPTDSSTLRVSFSDPDKSLALAGAQSVLKAFRDFFEQTDPMMYSQKLQELDKDRIKYQNMLNEDEQM